MMKLRPIPAPPGSVIYVCWRWYPCDTIFDVLRDGGIVVGYESVVIANMTRWAVHVSDGRRIADSIQVHCPPSKSHTESYHGYPFLDIFRAIISLVNHFHVGVPKGNVILITLDFMKADYEANETSRWILRNVSWLWTWWRFLNILFDLNRVIISDCVWYSCRYG